MPERFTTRWRVATTERSCEPSRTTLREANNSSGQRTGGGLGKPNPDCVRLCEHEYGHRPQAPFQIFSACRRLRRAWVSRLVQSHRRGIYTCIALWIVLVKMLKERREITREVSPLLSLRSLRSLRFHSLCFLMPLDFGVGGCFTSAIWNRRGDRGRGRLSACFSCLQMFSVVPMEGVEPTHSYEYQILSLARLPIPPHRLPRREI